MHAKGQPDPEALSDIENRSKVKMPDADLIVDTVDTVDIVDIVDFDDGPKPT